MNTQESPAALRVDRLSQEWPVSVHVETSARLHIGFMDLNFALGRRFGSVGFAIDMPRTRIVAQATPDVQADGKEAARAEAIVKALVEKLDLPVGAHVVVEDAIDRHAGLGSGTQLALAVGHAVARLNEIELSTRAIAALLGRGGRSGIGIGTFDSGGIVLDAGKDKNGGEPPPIVWRHDMPADWRVVLILDRGKRGMHGEEEAQTFRNVTAMAPETCGEICRLTLMQLVPAAMERDVKSFGAAVTEIQARVGDYFAPWQGGRRFTSPDVAGCLEWLAANGAAGIGQSSWGPTGYAIAENLEQARRLAEGVAERLRGNGDLEVRVCAPMNKGSRIVSTPLLSRARL